MPAGQVCPLPNGISFEEGAAIMLQGMTVEYLFHRVWPLKAGDSVLFHAAAGGVGLLACQWARSEGIQLIGTAGSDKKCELALKLGADHCINYREADFVSEVSQITNGAGVRVVMDGVGKEDTQILGHLRAPWQRMAARNRGRRAIGDRITQSLDVCGP